MGMFDVETEEEIEQFVENILTGVGGLDTANARRCNEYIMENVVRPLLSDVARYKGEL